MDLEGVLSSARLFTSEKRQGNRLKAVMEARDRIIERALYDSFLCESCNAAVRHELNPRDLLPPGCPGDGGPDMIFGMGVPDYIGRNVSILRDDARYVECISTHMRSVTPMRPDTSPNLGDLRSFVLGVNTPTCSIKDEVACFSNTGR